MKIYSYLFTNFYHVTLFWSSATRNLNNLNQYYILCYRCCEILNMQMKSYWKNLQMNTVFMSGAQIYSSIIFML
jgi:hypothetical protein